MVFSFQADGFRIIYVCVTTILWVCSSVFSFDYFPGRVRCGRYYISSLLTYAATIGLFLSADLLTAFIFFELLSLTSYPLVAHDETPNALKAAGTYLAVAVIGGMAALMGLLLLRDLTGTLDMKLLFGACKAVTDRRALYVCGALILTGFGAKAGLFPLHIWLPKAHSSAPAPASALLSGILTKCGVFGVIVISCEIFRDDANWGAALLVIGAATMLLGAILAVFSIDLKRTLACSSVSQIGFITVGVAMQCIPAESNYYAIRGTILHMINHSLFKLVLFLCAGVAYMNLHSVNFNEIRGFGRRKPLFAFAFLTAAAGIAGIPLFSGYVSKTLLHESIAHFYHLDRWTDGLVIAAEKLFIFTGGLTVAYMLKLISVLFGGNGGRSNRENALADTRRRAEKSRSVVSGDRYMSAASAVTLALSAAAIIILGSFPGLMDSIAGFGEGFMNGYAAESSVHYFASGNIRGALIPLAIGVFIHVFIIRTTMLSRDKAGEVVYIDRWPQVLDLETLLYRPFIDAFTRAGAFLAHYIDAFPDAVAGAIRKSILRPLTHEGFRHLLPRRIRKLLPERVHGGFFGKYYGFTHPDKSEQPVVQPVARAGFSISLLLFGAGMCAILIYLVIAAFS